MLENRTDDGEIKTKKLNGARFVYDKQTLLDIGTHSIVRKVRGKFVISVQKRKRGKRGGIKQRLRRTGKLPLPTITLSNVRSIRNKIDNICALCKFDQDYKCSGILCFTESWLTQNDTSKDFKIDHFTLFRLDRDSTTTRKVKGGGICLYINNGWCTNCHVIASISDKNIELLSLSLRPHYLPREFPLIYVIAIYIPPNANYNVAAQTIEEHAFQCLRKHPDAPVIILGDFNQCPPINPIFHQHVSVNTRNNNILDLCYSNLAQAYRSTQKPKIGNSDHNSVLLLPTYVTKLKQQKPTVLQIRNWSVENISRLQACFDCTVWEELMCVHNSIDEWTEVVTAYIHFCCDLCADNKQVTIYPNNKPWVTKRIKYYINMKKIAHMSGDVDKQVQADKDLKRVIREGKVAYKDKMEKNISGTKTLDAWKMIREMGGVINKKAEICSTNDIDVNQLNEFYCRFDPPQTNINAIEESITTHNTTSTLDISIETVESVLKSCKKGKAPGPDGLRGEVLSNCSQQLAIPLQEIFQRSVDEHRIPTKWKTSTIIPIPKKNPPKMPNDFRPVALTSIAMKCLEKIMKGELLKTLHENNILDQFQFAYQRQLSVEDALLTAINLISSHLDNSSSNHCRILYADFSSAFNAMNTSILIHKLHTLNLPLYLIEWYNDFLLDRPQNVKLGLETSNTKTLSNGCPQGCVSSPLLYIIYTNDCTSDAPNCSILKYADDTAVIGLLNDRQSETEFNQQIAKFESWCSDNHLGLNVHKTKEQIFDFRQKSTNLNKTKIQNQNVECVDTFRYLGITIDKHLRFTTHANILYKKCNQRLYILRKLRSFNVSKKTMKLVYNSLILSILTFGLPVWYGSCSFKEKTKLQRIVREAAKIINDNLQSLDSIYNKSVINKSYNILEQPRHPLHHHFEQLPSGRRYREVKCRTNRYKNTFIPTAIKAINKQQEQREIRRQEKKVHDAEMHRQW